MTALKGVAIVLIAAGILALVYRGFSYTKVHDAKVGSLGFSFKERERVNIPVWAGVGAVVAGAALLLVKERKS